MNFAQITVVGNTGKQVRDNQTQNGNRAVNFSVAVNHRIGGKDRTDWYTVELYGQQADTFMNNWDGNSIPVLVSGTPVFYQKRDGGTGVSIRATACRILRPKQDSRDEAPAPKAHAASAGKPSASPEEDFPEDDVPF